MDPLAPEPELDTAPMNCKPSPHDHALADSLKETILREVRLALDSGNAKYGPNDWFVNTTSESHLKGGLRHLGRDGFDDDTQLSHVAHAISRLVLYECLRRVGK